MKKLIVTAAAFLAFAAPASRAQQSMAGILADYDGELRESVRRADGVLHVDTPAMIAKLKSLHITTYVYLVWHAATDWDDLCNEFLPAAAQAGIDVWVYLVPPSECTPACSLPFGDDYVQWGAQIGQLSLRYPQLKAWAIDDFNSNLKTFTRDYVRQMTQAAKAVNPQLQFLPLMYFAQISTAFLDSYAGNIDGIIMAYRDDPHPNTQVSATLAPQLDSLIGLMQPYGRTLILMIYASALSHTPLPPSAEYVADTVRTGLSYLRAGLIGGVVTYVLPLGNQPDPNSLNPAHSGLGFAACSVLGGTHTSPGDYAAVGTDAAIDPMAGQYSLTFWQMHTFAGGASLPGYHFKQVLVNGQVIWERDVADSSPDQWMQETVDLTAMLSQQTSAQISFRILDKKGVSSYYATTRFDDAIGSGVALPDPGFESPDSWTAEATQPGLLAGIGIFDANRPQESFRAVQEQYGPHRLLFLAMALGDQALIDGAGQILNAFLSGDKIAAASAADSLAQAAGDRGDSVLSEQATLVAADLRN
jgi:hypothetical protein